MLSPSLWYKHSYVHMLTVMLNECKIWKICMVQTNHSDVYSNGDIIVSIVLITTSIWYHPRAPTKIMGCSCNPFKQWALWHRLIIDPRRDSLGTLIYKCNLADGGIVNDPSDWRQNSVIRACKHVCHQKHGNKYLTASTDFSGQNGAYLYFIWVTF